MKIMASAVSLASSHSMEAKATVSRRVEFRKTPETQTPEPWQDHTLFLTDPGIRPPLDTPGPDPDKTPEALDPKLALIRRILEALTGKPIVLSSMEDTRSGSGTAPLPPPSHAFSEAVAPMGWGLEVETRTAYDESELTTVQARGKVVTENGQTIDFTVDLSMEREFHTQENLLIRAGDALRDPLVINLDPGPVRLTDTAFAFDIDQDGQEENLPGLMPGRGFLVFDANGDGKVNHGGELFGPKTGNGFSELALLDLDNNGWIDASDTAFSALSFWEGPGGDLVRLADLGIGALSVSSVDSPFSITDASNRTRGIIRSTGVYLREDGGVGTLQHVDLSV